MAPLFSVLMPTHNRADVLGYAIQSVLWQSAPDFELLIVGDGCTDNTAEVVAQYQDPRIRWFDLPKAPYFGYANRNIALREARGEYVAFAADDDLLLPDHLALLAGEAVRTQAEWLYSRPVWVTSDGVVVPSMVNLHNTDELHSFLDPLQFHSGVLRFASPRLSGQVWLLARTSSRCGRLEIVDSHDRRWRARAICLLSDAKHTALPSHLAI